MFYNLIGDQSMNNERIVFHIDVNNAFLSWTAVKLLNEGSRVDIRKIPSVIGGDESKRHGVVLAKSPVAKKMGIKTGDTLYSARKKCKNIKVFPCYRQFYKEKSKELFSYLSKLSPDIEIFSVDECFIEMTNTNYLYSDYLALGYKIKDEIYRKFGYTVNVGIANNKLCAKMASDFEKPNKVHTLYNEEVKSKMWPLEIGKLFMIGGKSAEKLKSLGINTIGDLANTDINVLTKYFKNQAPIMIKHANGIDNSKVITEYSGNKCISVSETFERDIADKNILKKIMFHQVKKVAYLLRKQNVYTTTVAITFKNYDFKTYTRQIKLDTPTDSTNDIYEKIVLLFEKEWDGKKLRNIGVRLSNFTTVRNEQLDFFNSGNQIRNNSIDKIIDSINSKYGSDSVILASLNDDIASNDAYK